MPRFEIRVYVTPRADVADPEGQAIRAALGRFDDEAMRGVEVKHVGAGKVFDLSIEADCAESAGRAARAIADRVLANPNVEQFEWSLRSESNEAAEAPDTPDSTAPAETREP